MHGLGLGPRIATPYDQRGSWDPMAARAYVVEVPAWREQVRVSLIGEFWRSERRSPVSPAPATGSQASRCVILLMALHPPYLTHSLLQLTTDYPVG